MSSQANIQNILSRRAFLRRGMGLGFLGLAALRRPELFLKAEVPSSGIPGALAAPHFAPRARRVIFLYMSGGPSQFELFDPKPELSRRAGEPMPASLVEGNAVAQLQGQTQLLCLPSPFAFRRYGQSGHQISSLLPRTALMADDLTFIHSMVSDSINHDPAHTLMNTGFPVPGRPSMGSWILYGLGCETQSLPGFAVLISSGQHQPAQPLASRLWDASFLPASKSGVPLSGVGEPLPFLTSPRGVSMPRQARLIETINALARQNPNAEPPEIDAAIERFECAFRLQTAAPELTDLSSERRSVLDSYGIKGPDGSFAANCLMARRLVERGVRFVQVYHRDWDHHSEIKKHISYTAAEVDRGCAALLRDLKARGLLEDTLVVWAGEFGRTPMSQRARRAASDGRDHHIRAFTIWLAGGGIRPGLSYGRTDEFGYDVTENPVHVNDLHATILHLLGIDHKRLVVRAQGRDMRLTDVGGNVVRGVLA